MSEFRIFSVDFAGDSLVLNFMEMPTDVRVRGQVVQQRSLRLDLAHPDYAEDARLLQDLATRALRNALEDFTSSEPHNPSTDPDEDDDERGMGE